MFLLNETLFFTFLFLLRSVYRMKDEDKLNCVGKFYPGEGHYSTIFNYYEDIIDTLTS